MSLRDLAQKKIFKMKIFHIYKEPPVKLNMNKKNGKYMDMEKYWGHIITNRATRTKEKYAVRFQMDGSRLSYISEEDFKCIFSPCHEHIDETEKGLLLSKVDQVKNLLLKMSLDEAGEIFNFILQKGLCQKDYHIRKVNFDGDIITLIKPKT